MPNEAIGSLLSWLFPRGTRRNYYAALVVDSFRHPTKVLFIIKGICSRTSALYRLPEPKKGIPVLFIDDVFPDPRIGSGAPRTRQIINVLIEHGFRVTVMPLIQNQKTSTAVTPMVKNGIELMYGNSRISTPVLTRLLHYRKNYYTIVIVSRPTNMKNLITAIRRSQKNAAIVYDAEAIFATRKIVYRKLIGRPLTARAEKRLIEGELALARKADSVLTVSENDAAQFRNNGCKRVFVVRHAIHTFSTNASYHERTGILFVGPIHHASSPNEDAVLYFISEILPLIRRELDIDFTMVGYNRSKRVSAYQSAHIKLMGSVDDLCQLYNANRVFVAPTRYAAGVPLKVYEAAANGLPVVVTPLLQSQLGWEHGKELVCGADPGAFAKACINLHSDGELWRRIRDGALERVRRDCDYSTFAAQLREAVGVSAVARNA